MRVLLAVSALLFAAPGAAQPHPDPVRAAMPTGAPVGCVRLNQIRNIRIHDSGAIDFMMRNRQAYRNRLDGGSCPGLSTGKRFLYKTSSCDLRSIDTITVLRDPGLSHGATCGLGDFQPVKLAAR